MSKYTTEVRTICEHYAGLSESVGYLSVNEVIEKSLEKVFDFDFPIFDNSYRNLLESKILKHYYTREIGLETVGLWKLKLDTKMNEIMPYYNQLYKSELLSFNPFYDNDYTITSNRKTDGKKDDVGHVLEATNVDTTSNYTKNDVTDGTRDVTSHSETAGETNSNMQGKIVKNDLIQESTESSQNTSHTGKDASSGSSLNTYADTPQGAVTNLENNTYLTNARKITNNNTTDTTDNTITNGTVLHNTKSDATETNNTSTDSTSNDETDGTSKDVYHGTGNETYNGKDNTTGTVTNDSTANSVIKNLEDYTEKVLGKRGTESYSTLLNKFRDTFLNIDMMVIEDLSDLFLNLW